MTGAAEIGSLDRALLNVLQGDFPADRLPFRVLGEKLGIPADEVLRRVRGLHDAGYVRSIAGIFDAAGLGYRSTLAAMHVDRARLDVAAAVVNAHPGVSHNYARDHYFNLWFTLSLPGEEDAGTVISSLAMQAGAGEFIDLPAVRVFKLRVYFDMTGDGDTAIPAAATKLCLPDGGGLTLDDKRVVKQLCQAMPLEDRPFDALAEQSGLDVDYFLARMAELRERGILRRYSAVLRHRKAGFAANAMTCWQAPEGVVEEAGRKASSRKEVSHCYQRRTAPGWPYNLFAMVHGRSRAECDVAAAAISQDIGIPGFLQLYSTKEYKKERVSYFEWVK